MAFWDILTYIWILIAIWTLLPEYQKLKLWLANFFWKTLFWLSIVLIIILSFEIFSWYYNDIEKYLIQLSPIKWFFMTIFWGNVKTGVFSTLRIIQFLSLFSIYRTSKLSQYNKKSFKKLIDKLYDSRQYEILVKIINENIGKILLFTKIQKKIDNFFAKFKGKFIFKEKEDWGFYVDTNRLKWYKKIVFPIIRSLKVFLPKYESLTGYLPNKYIINEIFIKEENLWYKIIKSSKHLMEDQDIKKFVRDFLKVSLKNIDSRLSQSLWGLDFEPIEMKNELLLLLQKIWKKLDYAKIIDEVIHNIINEEQNKKLINLRYSPWGGEYNELNNNIITHIWHLIRSYRLIWTELDLWSMPMHLIKDLIEVTDRSKYQDNCYEYTTGTYYLITEYFDEISYLCDHADTRYLGSYFAMIAEMLSSEIVILEVKKSIISWIYWFLCNHKNKEEKKKYLKDFFEYDTDNKYKILFQLDAHDRITHYLDSANIDIYEICKLED